ncbi:MAG: hypothetical protein IPM15_07310 [Betaproteobacteria bacterium]|nr:hypothetical protein [Betaproteobacteria bacterium]
MNFQVFARSALSLVIAGGVVGCQTTSPSSGTGAQGTTTAASSDEAKLPTFEHGGYTWRVHQDTEGGNNVRTSGVPSRQVAAEAAGILCKKYGRIAQYQSHRTLLFGASVGFQHNCVK